MYKIFDTLVRAGPDAQEAVLQYFARVISLNSRRAGTHVSAANSLRDKTLTGRDIGRCRDSSFRFFHGEPPGDHAATLRTDHGCAVYKGSLALDHTSTFRLKHLCSRSTESILCTSRDLTE
jgi:hypothetical protein